MIWYCSPSTWLERNFPLGGLSQGCNCLRLVGDSDLWWNCKKIGSFFVTSYKLLSVCNQLTSEQCVLYPPLICRNDETGNTEGQIFSKKREFFSQVASQLLFYYIYPGGIHVSAVNTLYFYYYFVYYLNNRNKTYWMAYWTSST